ncbi:MAG: AraC family transcriptional regulator [Acholeplasmatales bacterium]|jgi:AraC family transcriptional regulator|nr:AraC family transcriptional regulator [Acholeplasmatales bacterium]
MEWVTCIKETIRFIEEHLTEKFTIDDVAKHVALSSLYLQRGFQIITGFSLGEYIRNRRLYEAGKEILATDDKMIDISYKYGYETPESFSKAFLRFHGYSPLACRKKHKDLHTFHRIQIEINVKGGNDMDFKFEELDTFKVIGLSRDISFEASYTDIPSFWNEFCQSISSGSKEMLKEAILNHCIGELGICFGEIGNTKTFKYMIGGFYDKGPVPKDLEVVEIPKNLWVKFKSVGAMPNAIQELNTRIFKEWLPGNKDYEIAAEYNIEWYSRDKNMNSSEYISEIWLPIKRK